ncbi:hypothetical protein CKO51_13840 [Rhodopirellula sp. SM50]|nr:hypothetical protein CKO51_13840 [Rhodopirellula sp. SM50]
MPCQIPGPQPLPADRNFGRASEHILTEHGIAGHFATDRIRTLPPTSPPFDSAGRGLSPDISDKR